MWVEEEYTPSIQQRSGIWQRGYQENIQQGHMDSNLSWENPHEDGAYVRMKEGRDMGFMM